MNVHITAEPKRDLRERILVEAERLFRHYGYSKTTVADIARELGMSSANVYRFFASKAAINEAITERMLSARVAETARIAKGPGTPSERVRAILLANHRMTVDVLLDHKKVHEMVTVAMHEQWDVVRAFVATIVEICADVIVEGIETGEFRRQDPSLSARCVHHAFVAYVHPGVVAEFIEDARKPTPDEMVEFILAALRA